MIILSTKHYRGHLTKQHKSETLLASFNLWNNAKRGRAYPNSQVGDSVRVPLRYASGHEKRYMPTLSKHIYKVTVVDE